MRFIINWEDNQLVDVYNGYDTFYSYSDYGFVEEDGSHSNSGSQVTKLCYYSLTTLSTIGFGDFLPKSVKEKITVSFIMIIGVTVFSLIMNKLIQILNDYKEMTDNRDDRNLSKWIMLMSKFNQGKPLSRELINNIEDFFNFYWEKNPLMAFKTEDDVKFISQLPDVTSQEIVLDYLFRNFFFMFQQSVFYVEKSCSPQGSHQFVNYESPEFRAK